MYLVFVWDNYYPSGGWRDFKGTFYSLEDAFQCVLSESGDWYQIVENNEVIREGTKS